jgi:hypothetical protein
MHSKNNRVNKNFQIAYFLAGSCHTIDGAYALLKDLQEDREMAIAQLRSSSLKEQSKIVKAKHIIKNGEEWERLEAQADLAEIEDNKKFSDKNIEAAKKELDFIIKCIEKIQPHRAFAHLPDDEAHEAAQFDEWKFELISRAENYLLTTGSIPTDHFVTMRQHPAFIDEILPVIERTKQAILTNTDKQLLINNLNSQRIDIPKLIESPDVRKDS